MTAAIRARAATTPDELALGDDSGFRTWAQAAADLERAAGAMLAVASDPAYRISVLGDNAIPTLEAHAAGLTVGVGTVATSRQLRANELADQYADANPIGTRLGAIFNHPFLEANALVLPVLEIEIGIIGLFG